ncbi:MAG: hypothetical protein JOZ33_17195 [Acidobacteriaceae bacterium]|nr:hypothetical protein [Acidobacteriaceae bacterium]MBV8675165.1 hypothetical protein [Acidobacteriaceae bacterium]
MCQIKSRRAAAIGLLPLGLVFVSLSMFLPHYFHPSGPSAQDWTDGVRGLIMGIGLGIELIVVIALNRQRPSSSN